MEETTLIHRFHKILDEYQDIRERGLTIATCVPSTQPTIPGKLNEFQNASFFMAISSTVIGTDEEDPRIKDWFLMSSPIPTLISVCTYLFIVKVLLPAFMKHRKPYKLQRVLVFYNFLQVIISTILFVGFAVTGWVPLKYDLGCSQVHSANSIEGIGIQMIAVSYSYYLSKFTEFFDTVLFVLRKKESHVSFLHVYHHSVMPLYSWMLVKYVPDSQVTLFGLINSFVHIVMYTYYMLSAMGPEMQKYLWWKKHITLLQLVQFSVGIIHSCHAFINGCNLPRILSSANFIEANLFFILFFNFYLKSYRKTNVHRKIVDETNINNKKQT